MSYILCTLEGKYQVHVRVQDGTEPCGEFDTEPEAQRAWKQAERTLNHRTGLARQRAAVLYQARVAKVEILEIPLQTLQHYHAQGESSSLRILELPEQARALLHPPLPSAGGSTTPTGSCASTSTSTSGDSPPEPVRRIRRIDET